MASYEIQTDDLALSLQSIMLLKLRLQIYELKDDRYVNEICGNIVSGSGSISADSDIRRTYSLQVIPDRKSKLVVEESGYIWLNKKVKVSLGIYNYSYPAQIEKYRIKIKIFNEYINKLDSGKITDYECKVLQRLGVDTSDYSIAAIQLQNLIDSEPEPVEIKWYPQGSYLFTTSSATYDATNNQLSINCSDLMALLDGSRNGTLGQLIIDCPAYKTLLSTSLISAAQIDGIDITDYNAIFQWCVTQSEFDYFATDIVNQTPEVKNAIFSLITKTLSSEEEINYLNIVKSVYPNTDYIYDANVRQLNAHYTYREYIIQTLGQLGRFTDYNIDEIGELGAFKDYNPDWEEYRNNYPEWQFMPEDISFSAGATVLSMINEILGYVVGFEKYIDADGTFCVNQIPTCYSDNCVLADGYMQDILISESNSIDFSEVKNIANLWGQVLEPDFFAKDGVTYAGNVYSMNIAGYDDKYMNGDIVAIHIPTTNSAGASININGFGVIPIYNGNTEQPIEENAFSANETYCFKIYKKRENATDIIKVYFLGQWQVHTMAVLVDSAEGNTWDIYHTTSGTDVARYSKEYFMDVYGCDNVYMEVQPTSPYTVQKIGEITASYSGGEYEKLTDVPKALAHARHMLWTTSGLTDQISIVTRMVPFMDVNKKIEFYSHTFDTNASHQYIVKSLSHDMTAGTTSWTLQRFYPMYNPDTGETYNYNDDIYEYDGTKRPKYP